jgi:hypothetical protein
MANSGPIVQIPGLCNEEEISIEDDGTGRIFTPEEEAYAQALMMPDRRMTPPYGIGVRFLAIQKGKPTYWRYGYVVSMYHLGPNSKCGTYIYDPATRELIHHRFVADWGKDLDPEDNLDALGCGTFMNGLNYNDAISFYLNGCGDAMTGFVVGIANIGINSRVYPFVWAPTTGKLYSPHLVSDAVVREESFYDIDDLNVPEVVEFYKAP